MAAYLNNRCDTGIFSLSSDPVAKAVGEDKDTAVRLMKKEGYDEVLLLIGLCSQYLSSIKGNGVLSPMSYFLLRRHRL